MNRHLLDLRVCGPIAIAALLFWWRPGTLPPPAPTPTARAVALPALQVPAESTQDADYELDPARSVVRFLVEDAAGRQLAVCQRASGRLRVRRGGAERELELDLELGSLAPVDASGAGLDLWHELGVHRGSEIAYRATQLAATTTNLPGVTARLWLGSLRLDGRVVRQPMELWQVALPGQPLRLQGHGTVPRETYGLPARGWLGFGTNAHDVTLGLDLVWRRHRAR
ncbi:MAG: hypothetical protein JNL08_14435 [Planctomycetes bacterium]|nr:hypothetical protein [Planctomycetota bacterium]